MSEECPSCASRRKERLKLDRRIHNQRVALRENWMIAEMRQDWLKRWPIKNRYLDYMKKQMRVIAELRTALQARVVVERGEHYRVVRIIRRPLKLAESAARTKADFKTDLKTDDGPVGETE